MFLQTNITFLSSKSSSDLFPYVRKNYRRRSWWCHMNKLVGGVWSEFKNSVLCRICICLFIGIHHSLLVMYTNSSWLTAHLSLATAHIDKIDLNFLLLFQGLDLQSSCGLEVQSYEYCYQNCTIHDSIGKRFNYFKRSKICRNRRLNRKSIHQFITDSSIRYRFSTDQKIKESPK